MFLAMLAIPFALRLVWALGWRAAARRLAWRGVAALVCTLLVATAFEFENALDGTVAGFALAPIVLPYGVFKNYFATFSRNSLFLEMALETFPFYLGLLTIAAGVGARRPNSATIPP